MVGHDTVREGETETIFPPSARRGHGTPSA